MNAESGCGVKLEGKWLNGGSDARSSCGSIAAAAAAAAALAALWTQTWHARQEG